VKQSKLFARLPEAYACTPDGMAIDQSGNLILACPNFANPGRMPGCLLKIDKSRNIQKWVDIPILAETGLACPMGIAFGPDWDLYVVENQCWLGYPEVIEKGRILRLRIQDNAIIKTTVVASGMEHPNGIRIRGSYIYVTQSTMTKVKDPSGLLVSCVYRFHLNDENIKITNTLDDPNLLTTFITQNLDCQYGADGIEFDHNGDLLVGNFGDGAVHRIKFNEDDSVDSNTVWAKNPAELQTTDGMIMDRDGNLYIADFSANAIGMVKPDGTVIRLAQSPDSDGLSGELDQPGEPIIWEGNLVISCFDLVTGPDKVNTRHELPATLAEIEMS